MLFIQKEFRNLSQCFYLVMQKWIDSLSHWRKEKELRWYKVLSITTKWRTITCKLTTSSRLTIVNTTSNFWNVSIQVFSNSRRSLSLRKNSSFQEEMKILELRKKNKFKNSRQLNHNRRKSLVLMVETTKKSQSPTNVLKVALTESSIAKIQK